VSARALLDSLGRDFDDATLAAHLMTEGFDTQVGRMTQEILARAGLAAMRGWIGSGVIWQRVSKILPGFERPANIYWSSAQTEEFALDAVADGLEHFTKRIMAGRWSPDGGAGLMNYFLNGCVLAFTTEYRRFARLGTRNIALTAVHEVPAHTAGPGDIAVMRDQIARARVEAGDSVMDIIALRDQGYTGTEIATLLSLTLKQVEGRLSRWKRKMTTGGDDAQ
jgi:hypothetical protein